MTRGRTYQTPPEGYPGYYPGQRFRVGDQAKLFSQRYRDRCTWSPHAPLSVSSEPVLYLTDEEEVEVLKYDRGALIVQVLRTGHVGYLG